ncbi:MAG: hypothetical protein K5984_04520 [Bacteroidales bacterium]|nr:hypothetical protein [Bacteroidales bacterium]
MKTTENIKLTNVGKLLGELEKYKKNHWDDCVVAWLKDDGRTFGVVGMGNDKDGDLRIIVEEVDDVLDGIWTVADVISSLEDIDKETRVYLAGDGLYLAIDSNGDIFNKADDDDAVGCWGTVFGEYEEEPQGGQADKESGRPSWIEIWKEKIRNWKGVLECSTFLLCIPLTAYGLYYNIAALVKHSSPVWESILWIIFLGLLLYVCIDNLFFPNRHK